MTWFKVDDGLPNSRKVRSIPRAQRCAAMGLWTLAGAWCSGELTDGHLPDYMVEELGGTSKLAGLLVAAGLWEVDDDGYQFHDWHDRNPSRATVIEKRDKNAERLRQWREQNAHRNTVTNGVTHPATESVTHGVTNTVTNEDVTLTPTRPDPTRPDPLVSSAAHERGQRLPDDWEPASATTASLRLECPDIQLDRELRKFRDHWRAKTGRDATKLDWDATWRNWVRNARPGASAQTAGSEWWTP